MASTYLTRTPSSAGNRKIWTLSFWIKRSEEGIGNQGIVSSGSSRGYMYFRSLDEFYIEQYNAGDEYSILTNRLFRDTSAWYHLVIAFDTTQSTASNRVKLYVNGVQETSFQKATYPSQNFDTNWNSAVEHVIGRISSVNHFNGLLSHIHFIDGTAYDASAFGEFDANGVWKIKTSPSVTYGNNGFFILKNGNSVTDQSGNGNNFTVAGGTLTNTEDSPSNVFATWNPLDVRDATGRTLSNGNTTVNEANNSNPSTLGTLGASSGKWYYEIKIDSRSGSATDNNLLGGFGWYKADNNGTEDSTNDGLFLLADSRVRGQGSTTGSSVSAIVAVGDIIQCALDLDGGNCYIGKNGNWYDGSGSFNQTFANSTAIFTSVSTDFIWTAGRTKGSSANNTTELSANFGNGYFGTTAVASAGTNASGNGIFEYDVPTGYTALSTKGLNL